MSAGPAARPPTPAETGPVRTCVGCRGRGPRSDLVRVVRGADGRLLVDERRRAPGRGAWLHPDPACLDRAERRRAFGRALRVAGPADATAVRAWFDRKQLDRQGTGRSRPGRTATVEAESGFTQMGTR